MTRRLALGLSGGGDSLALLHALRDAYPDVELHALIVDHGLRTTSAQEAQATASWAHAAGAVPQILTWNQPRKGQGHAREARHRLLAEACRELQINCLCLAHTLDDRIETLRMRQARPGGDAQLTGPFFIDPSPTWPEGRGLVIVRPLLSMRRHQLRAYLSALGQSWIDDPSNEDLAYERVQLRQDAWPEGGDREVALLARSDDALRQRDRQRAEASTLIHEIITVTPWGGAQIHRPGLMEADQDIAKLVLRVVVMAVSGQGEEPAPRQLAQLHDAACSKRALTMAGVALTADGWVGRDPGASLGRADGTAGVQPIHLEPGQSAVFDGRWQVTAYRPIEIAPWGETARLASDVPAPLRPALMAVRDGQTGELLALPGVNATDVAEFEQLAGQRIAMRLLPQTLPTWFDAKACARKVELALAKPG